MVTEPEPFVDGTVVAAHLGVSPPTVERWRYELGGPPYFRLGRAIRYRLSEVTAWAEAQREASNNEGRGGRPDLRSLHLHAPTTTAKQRKETSSAR